MLKFTIALAVALLAKMALAYLPTPQEVVALATATPLEFKGKFGAPGSSTGRESCVFENQDTVIVSDYCSKDEIPVAGIQIFPKGYQSTLKFYVEVEGDPYATRREEYDPAFWRVGVVKHPSVCNANMSLAEFPACMEAMGRTWTCGILMIQPLGIINQCNDKQDPSIAQSGVEWLVSGREFWDQPTAQWYTLLGSIKTLTQANL